MKFGVWGQLTDVIKCVKFLVDRFRGYGVLTPPKLPFPIDLLRRPYNSVALPCDTVMTYDVLMGTCMSEWMSRLNLTHSVTMLKLVPYRAWSNTCLPQMKCYLLYLYPVDVFDTQWSVPLPETPRENDGPLCPTDDEEIYYNVCMLLMFIPFYLQLGYQYQILHSNHSNSSSSTSSRQ